MTRLLPADVEPKSQEAIASETETRYRKHHEAILERTDRFFAKLLGLEWVLGIVAAVVIAPRTWSGTMSQMQ